MGITEILDVEAPLWPATGPFTPTENQAHLAMWAMLAAPLMAGNDVAAMPPAVRAVLTDPDVIALDQDPLGRQARRIRSDGPTQIWTRPLADGSTAVALLNPTDTTTVAATSAEQAGAPESDSYTLFDLWSKTTTNSIGPIRAPVPPHGVVLFRLRPHL